MNNFVKVPGFVDVHTHLREPGNTHKENFLTGTKAAIAGGYTQILDMPNNDPPTVTAKSINQKMKLAHKKIWCDVGFNFGATKSSSRIFPKIQQTVFGLKVYMNKTTGPLLIEKKSLLEELFKNWQSQIPIMVHAIGDTVEKAIKLAEKHSRKIHVCHITGDQIKIIKSAKKRNVTITSEVTPHHLFLNKNDVEDLGTLAMMQPPLGTCSINGLFGTTLKKLI